jgi:hypothetical protein
LKKYFQKGAVFEFGTFNAQVKPREQKHSCVEAAAGALLTGAGSGKTADWISTTTREAQAPTTQVPTTQAPTTQTPETKTSVSTNQQLSNSTISTNSTLDVGNSTATSKPR